MQHSRFFVWFNHFLFFSHWSQQEITKTYRQLVLKHHPDKCKEENAGEVFQKIVQAYGVVKKKKEKEKDDDSDEWETNEEGEEEEEDND